MSTTDATIASIGLPKHPPVEGIVDTSQTVTDRLRSHGRQAVVLARTLAARGYPGSTLGDGGSRGTDSTSSTEHAAGANREVKPSELQAGHWEQVDVRLAQLLRAKSQIDSRLDSLLADVCAHADTIDPTPAGTGECAACGRFCRPDKERPGYRLRSGLCPTDHRAWLRAGKPKVSDWARVRRNALTDPNGVLHTPEPDHDIDLTSERLSP